MAEVCAGAAVPPYPSAAIQKGNTVKFHDVAPFREQVF